MKLDHVSYRAGKMEYRSRRATEPEWALATYLEEARKVLDAAAGACAEADDEPLSDDFEELRWFTMPSEARAELEGRTLEIRRGVLRLH